MLPDAASPFNKPGGEPSTAVKEAQELRPYLQGDLWLLTRNDLDSQGWAA
jgi:hypothetical protein